jgi:hypothetical protein
MASRPLHFFSNTLAKSETRIQTRGDRWTTNERTIPPEGTTRTRNQYTRDIVAGEDIRITGNDIPGDLSHD